MRLSLESLQDQGKTDMIAKLSQEFRELNGEMVHEEIEYDEDPQASRRRDQARISNFQKAIE
jgi:hypothetical protein